MKKLLLLGTLICSLPLMATGANKKTETTDEFIDSLVKGPNQAKETDDFKEEQAEGTYFGDDSVSTKSKIKTGTRLVGMRVGGAAVMAGGLAVYTLGALSSGGATIVLPMIFGGLSATMAGEGILLTSFNGAITPLEIAIKEDNLTQVKKLLSKNPKLAGLTGPNGRLPLHWAAMKNTDVAIVKELINAYPKALKIKTESGVIPLAYAIKDKYGSSTASFKKLLGLKHNDADNHEVFNVMLQADPSCTQILFGKDKKIIGKDIDLKNTLFHKAALVNDPYYIQALLKVDPQGATRANALGNLPLHITTVIGNKEITSIILKANPEAVNIKNNDGKTPIDLARNDEIKKMLGAKLKVGFLDNLKGTFSSKTTTLHIAANKGDNETLLKILKKEPSSAAMPDKDGNLPLHLAAMREDGLDAVKALLKAFPNGTTIKNLQGQTAEDVAATEEIKNYLFL